MRSAASRAAGATAALVTGVAVAAVAALVLAACGTTARAGADEGGPAVPTTDDPSYVTVQPPAVTTLDLSATMATPSATVVVSDGLTFSVTGWTCGLDGVRADGYAVPASGEMCLVQLDVTNTGDTPQHFTPDRALLLDGADAANAVPPSADALQLAPLAAMDAQVPAATRLSGTLVYDVPRIEADRALRFDDGPSVRLAAVTGG